MVFNGPDEQFVGGRTMGADGGIGGTYEEIFVPLHGAYQAHNALLAVAAVEAFLGGVALPADVVEAAFAGVTSPGRLELVRNSPTVLVDAAHNPAGARAAMEAVAEAFAFDRLIGVFGVMGDKDVEGILVELESSLAEIVVTHSSSMRAMELDDLADLARDVFGEDRVHVVERLDDAIALAADLAETTPTAWEWVRASSRPVPLSLQPRCGRCSAEAEGRGAQSG